MQQPDLNPPFYTGGGSGSRHVGIHGGGAEAASPISSRSAAQGSMFDDFGGEEAMIGAAAGEEGDRAGSGNRWPRQETLLLLKLRSEMDSAFRDATLKGPLWEDVSRKLGELGYIRSAKKCKEKFENVHKYYKRTKEGRAGRQDGKTYRFFSQLEALHSPTAATAPAAFPSFPLPPPPPPNSNLIPPQFTESPGIASLPPPPAPRSDPPPTELVVPPLSLPDLAPVIAGHVSFSSNSSSSSSSDSDTDDECRGVPNDGRKRKRESWPGNGGKTMAFFEGIMKEMMERQEMMQQRLLDTIEKREHDRMVREEAWKRQEMVRLNREYELMAHERAMAANRDAAVISFLQKFTGKLQKDPSMPSNAPEPPSGSSQPETNKVIPQCDDIIPHHPPQSAEPDADMPEVFIGGCLDVVSPAPPSSSRWPKTEVLALIKLRSGLETRYIDPGPKGPLWEEISLAMKKLGYNRSTKRCKEKWENINKYFKKVKEGNKKRPEDAKTCPYYHELDALYRRKHQHEIATTGIPDPPQQETNRIPDHGRGNFGNGGGGGIQLQRSNGAGISQVFFGGPLSSSNVLKKPEDIIKELMEQQHQGDDDEYDDDDEDDEEGEEEDGKLRYEVQFQRQNTGSGASGNPRGSAGENAPSTSNAGSFLAMVQ